MFVSAGGVMQSIVGGQDFRSSSFATNLKDAVTARVTRRLCLSGFPFTLGFYSKDIVLSGTTSYMGVIILFLLAGRCLATVIYSYRFVQILYAFHPTKFSIFVQSNRWRYTLSILPLLFINSFIGTLSHFITPTPNLNFRILDLLIGCIILLTSILIYKILLESRVKPSRLIVRLGFINWLRRGGVSTLLVLSKLHIFEKSWLETVTATYQPFSWFKNIINLDSFRSLKVILMYTPMVIAFNVW